MALMSPAVAIAPAAAGAVIAFAQERELRVWRGGNSDLIVVGSAEGPISLLAVDADGARVASVHDKVITLWDVDARRALWQATAGKRPSAVVFHGRRVVFADKFGEVWSIAEAPAADGAAAAAVAPAGPEPAFEFGVVSPITAMILSEDQRRIVTGDADKRIRVSPFPAAFVIESFCMGSKSAPTALSLAPAGDALFAAGAGGVLLAFDPANGAELATLVLEPTAPINAVCALAGSGCALASGGRLLVCALDRRAGGGALRVDAEIEIPADVRGAICALYAASDGAALWAVCSGGEVLHYVAQPSGGAMRLDGRHVL
jgi:WD40 repeat protein